MQIPISAFAGDGPYVFVCYAHHDMARVYPDIGWLNENHINVWYDEGISPGVEWSEELGHALEGSQQVVFFVSQASVNSRHCRDEVHFALSRGIPVVAVYLEDVVLPVGLELSIGSTQAVMAHQFNADEYRARLLACLSSGISQKALDPGSRTTQRSQLQRRKTRTRRMVALAAIGLCCAVGFGAFLKYQPSIMAAAILRAPWLFNTAIDQDLGFAVTADGTRIAYAVSGSGYPLLIVLGWGTHLERGMMSPMYDDGGTLAMTSRAYRVVRYDGRGFGLSDRDVTDWGLEARVQDIEAVVDALGLERFALYAFSAGGPAGIAYAAKHPDRVSHLVLASTQASFALGDSEKRSFLSALDLFEQDWDTSPILANLMVDFIEPRADEVPRRVMSEFLRRSGNGQAIAGFFRTHVSADVSDAAASLSMPVYVLHANDDAAIPLEAGRKLASLIPHVEFDIVEGRHETGTGNTPVTRQMILDWLARKRDWTLEE